MKKNIILTIESNDLFFIDGMKESLKQPSQINKKIIMTNELFVERNTDIKNRLNIRIYKSKKEPSRALIGCLEDGLCIFKNESITETHATINNAARQLTLKLHQKRYCSQCEPPIINPIERKVLLGINAMFSQEQIASLLNDLIKNELATTSVMQ